MKKAPIAMPPALASKYEFTAPVYGGPVFDFPQYSLYKVNLAELSEPMAERLLERGWNGIRRKDEAPPSKPPKTVPET